jgi:hypothetical protein
MNRAQTYKGSSAIILPLFVPEAPIPRSLVNKLLITGSRLRQAAARLKLLKGQEAFVPGSYYFVVL